MEVSYAILHHNHDPDPWRWWCGVHEVFLDPVSGVRYWSAQPVGLIAHGDETGPAALDAEVRRILAEVSGQPVLRTTDLMAVGGGALDIYSEASPDVSAPTSAVSRFAAE